MNHQSHKVNNNLQKCLCQSSKITRHLQWIHVGINWDEILLEVTVLMEGHVELWNFRKSLLIKIQIWLIIHVIYIKVHFI
jgi:hypothetical protein